MKKILFHIVCICLAFHGTSQTEKILHPAPVVDYSFTGLCLGDSTYFLNKTQMAQDFTWKIYIPDPEGDSLIYESQAWDITFLFPVAGDYKVVLWADNGHLVNKTRTLTLGNKTQADFEFVPCENIFINLSSCADSVFWDFGDGNTSIDIIPKHTYVKKDTYSVTLTVKKGNKSDTITKSIIVKALGYPLGGFTYTVVKDTVYFLANDSLSDEYYWSFGDTTYANLDSTGWKIAHYYTVLDSTYEVSLMVLNSCGLSSLWLPVTPKVTAVKEKITSSFIHVFPNPVIGMLNVSIDLDMPEVIQVFIFDSSGKLVMDRKINYSPGITTAPFNLENLSPGLYALQVRTKTRLINKKICLTDK